MKRKHNRILSNTPAESTGSVLAMGYPCDSKNFTESFASTGKLRTFAVPNLHKTVCVSKDIQATAAYKASSSFWHIFWLQSIWRFGDHRKRLASFVTYIAHFFRPMPNLSKNLTANAQGASASTPAARKTVFTRFTKAELIDLLEFRPASIPFTYLDFYRCALSLVARWCCDVRCGRFVSSEALCKKIDVLRSLFEQR